MEEIAEFVARIDKKMDKLKDTRATIQLSILMNSQANFRETNRGKRFASSTSVVIAKDGGMF